MKTAICDSRIPEKALKNLKKYCGRIILLPPFELLSEQVSAHPDMLLFPISERRIILTHPAYKERLAHLMQGCDYSIIPISEKAAREYPNDILLNVARVGSKIFCRLPHTSKALIALAEKMGITPVDVRQGYAKCSTLVLDESAIVTSDPSIAKRAKGCGIEVLVISPGGVALKGYNCGFIGGASGCDGEIVFFCGDLMAHPDGKKIESFCLTHGKAPVSLSGDPLYDVGTIFFI